MHCEQLHPVYTQNNIILYTYLRQALSSFVALVFLKIPVRPGWQSLGDLPASDSQELGIKVCTTTAWLQASFLRLQFYFQWLGTLHDCLSSLLSIQRRVFRDSISSQAQVQLGPGTHPSIPATQQSHNVICQELFQN